LDLIAFLTSPRNPAEFMDYNCSYTGVKDWLKRQQIHTTGKDEGLDAINSKLAGIEIKEVEALG
jgi:hypothetical protein